MFILPFLNIFMGLIHVMASWRSFSFPNSLWLYFLNLFWIWIISIFHWNLPIYTLYYWNSLIWYWCWRQVNDGGISIISKLLAVSQSIMECDEELEKESLIEERKTEVSVQILIWKIISSRHIFFVKNELCLRNWLA